MSKRAETYENASQIKHSHASQQYYCYLRSGSRDVELFLQTLLKQFLPYFTGKNKIRKFSRRTVPTFFEAK